MRELGIKPLLNEHVVIGDKERQFNLVGINDIGQERVESGAADPCQVGAHLRTFAVQLMTDQAHSLGQLFTVIQIGFTGEYDLAKEVTVSERYEWIEGSWVHGEGYPARAAADLPWHVVAYDYGVKRNILRMLVDRGCRLTVVPAQTPAAEVLAMSPDGVFLSNGPGDPEPCDYAITAIRELLETDIPVFGICLGHQLLGLASGAETVKMKFGHHGANHPVQNLDDGTVLITSQNHGFAVDETRLPDNLRVTHKSLFDDSLQGIHRTDKPAFSFQGHPEASPGPHDAAPLFDHFIALIEARARNAA